RHVAEKFAASILRQALKHHPEVGKGLREVEVDGEAVTLVYKRDAVRYRAGPKMLGWIAELRRDPDPDEIGLGELDLLAWEDRGGGPTTESLNPVAGTAKPRERGQSCRRLQPLSSASASSAPADLGARTGRPARPPPAPWGYAPDP